MQRLQKYLVLIPISILVIVCAAALAKADSNPPTAATQEEIENLLGHWQTSDKGVFIHFFGTLADKAARPYKNLSAIISAIFGRKLTDYEGGTSTNLGKRKEDVYCAFPLLHNLGIGALPKDRRDAWLAAERDGLITKELANYYMVVRRIGPPVDASWNPPPITDMIIANINHRAPSEPDTIACSPVLMRSLGLQSIQVGTPNLSEGEYFKPPVKVTAYLIKKGPLTTAVFNKQFEHPTVIISVPIGQED